jgi:hypothetical protein
VLPTAARAAGLAVLIGFAVALLFRGLGASHRLSRHGTAAEVEAAFPDLGQRVCTTLDYTEPGAEPIPASPELVRTLRDDTERRTGCLDFRPLVPWRSVVALTAVVGVIVVGYLIALLANAELRIAALRVFLVPVGYTELAVEPGDQTLRVGQDLTVRATLSGRPVPGAELQHRRKGSEEDWARLSLAPEGSRQPVLGTLQLTLKDLREDLEYRVVAGDLGSPTCSVTILHPLVLEKLEATVEPPAYTRRPTVTSTDGNVKVIEGSTVRLRFTLDRPPQVSRVILTAPGAAEALPPVELTVEGRELVGTLPDVKREVEYELFAATADGMRLEGERYRIAVQPDRKPTLRFVRPEERVEVTPSTEVRMRVEASDDFGLARAGIVYQIGNGPKKTLLLREDPAQPTSLRLDPPLALEEQALTHQDAVTYYAFAEDNHPTQPRRAVTELRFIDIRPYKRAYQMLETGGS